MNTLSRWVSVFTLVFQLLLASLTHILSIGCSSCSYRSCGCCCSWSFYRACHCRCSEQSMGGRGLHAHAHSSSSYLAVCVSLSCLLVRLISLCLSRLASMCLSRLPLSLPRSIPATSTLILPRSINSIMLVGCFGTTFAKSALNPNPQSLSPKPNDILQGPSFWSSSVCKSLSRNSQKPCSSK